MNAQAEVLINYVVQRIGTVSCELLRNSRQTARVNTDFRNHKMHQPRVLRLAVSIIVCFLLQAQCADKYTDENRPYEFGFKIAGEQHRHESKDKDGIIMGEFGFITADDVYHVTVYATDKEGHFKIISMKNIHLKSSPGSSPGSQTSSRQGHALALPPAQAASVQASASPQRPSASQPVKPIALEPPGKSCSSCSIPTTTTRAPPAYNQANGINNNYNSPNQFGSPGSSPQNQEAFPPYPGQQNNVQGGFGGQSDGSQGQQNYPVGQQNYPQQGSGTPAGAQTYGQQPQSAQNYPGSQSSAQGSSSPNAPNNYAQPNYGQGNPQLNVQSPGPNSYSQNEAGGRAPKQYNGPEQQFNSNTSPNGPQGLGLAPGGQPGFAKPTLVSAQMQIVDKNTDVYALRPGENKGLPPGLTKDDVTQLLYTFNYTVGFHGHFEEGYTNGVKKGYYYVTGRNGVRTRIDYVADDSGFHPKVSQDVLDLLSDDVPKPETEKDAKYGLKGYEFKWMFYPVDS